MRLIVLAAANCGGEPAPNGVERVGMVWWRQLDEFSEPVETLLIVADFVRKLQNLKYGISAEHTFA